MKNRCIPGSPSTSDDEEDADDNPSHEFQMATAEAKDAYHAHIFTNGELRYAGSGPKECVRFVENKRRRCRKGEKSPGEAIDICPRAIAVRPKPRGMT